MSKEGIGCVTCTQITGLSLIFLSPLLHLTVSFFSSFSPSDLSLSVLETLFLKLKQKHTLGAYLILSTHTHTPERAACLHTPTHPHTHVHAYTHTCIHPLLRLLLHTRICPTTTATHSREHTRTQYETA